jgi:hypothetical protein
MSKDPLFPWLVVPVLRDSIPLTPEDPLLEVRMRNCPELDARLKPVAIDIDPPEPCAAIPASTYIEPPRPAFVLVFSPASMEIVPPDTAAPLEASPLVVPLLRVMDPKAKLVRQEIRI